MNQAKHEKVATGFVSSPKLAIASLKFVVYLSIYAETVPDCTLAIDPWLKQCLLSIKTNVLHLGT